MSTRPQQIFTTLATIAMLVALLWAQQQGYLGSQGPDPSGGGGSAKTPQRASSYEPQGPAPAQALPGGSLEAHEGRGHTLARHVGRSTEQLRERQRAEHKPEVSTFPDLATAERAVARALYEKRREINAWLAEGARGDTAVTWRSADVVGRVLRESAGAPVPGHTTHVVLYPSDRFPEGFAIVTAYVRLP